MKIEFQKDILRFLTQRRSARAYLSTVEADLFTDSYDYLAYCVVKGFYDKYNTQPTKTECFEYLRRDTAKNSKDVTPEILAGIEASLQDAYKPYAGNEELIKDTLITEYQLKLTRDLFRDKSTELKKADGDFVAELYREVSRISKLSDKSHEEKEQNRGTFLLKEHTPGDYDVIEGMPTYLTALNNMTAIGGFVSPQLTVIMSGPKRFKTGTLLNIALGYTRDGKNVYYADTENDQKAIKSRLWQTMLQCTHRELVSGKFDTVLEEQIKRYKIMGGDFKCDFFPANTKTIQDIEEELDYLKEEYDWEPDIICYDNLDNFLPTNKTIKEKRLQIQAVYFEAIRLQKKRSMAGFTLSQVGRNAVNKRIIESTDFAEDFGKAANCHAAFAVCADDFEMAANVRRIVPVVQRQGVDASSNAACYIRLDAKKNYIEEISFDEWKATVEAQESASPSAKKAANGQKRPQLKGVKDV